MAEKMPLRPLTTRWGEAVDPKLPLPEYPRPQLRRRQWVCLNGPWEYAITDEVGGEVPEYFEGEIIVPFSPESALSGVGRQLMPGQTLWYRRRVRFAPSVACEQSEQTREPDAPRAAPGRVSGRASETSEQREVRFAPSAGHRVMLHFGAVDQNCALYVNGQFAGEHAGGYWPFGFDITPFLLEDGSAELALAVTDDTSAGTQGYGKQSLDRGGIWYTPQSGIWQTVWAEYLPAQHIRSLRITPDYDGGAVEFRLGFAQPEAAPPVKVQVLDGKTVVAEGDFTLPVFKLKIPDFKSWSPDSPFLYDVALTAGEDVVVSYFGMRKFGTVTDKAGHKRLALNGRPIFHTGLLDQGYWPEGLYTPPSDEAMVWEISELKRLGFNMLRKHIKIEPLRWYYHCDRLGMLVWQDFVSGGGPYNRFVTQVAPFIGMNLRDDRYALFGRRSTKGCRVFEANVLDTVQLLYNCVCISVWVPFNEGWGQFDAVRIADKVKSLDPTRLIDHASGWHDQGGGDFHSPHVYFRPFKMKPDRRGRVEVLSEFGGYSCKSEGHMAAVAPFGYKMLEDGAQLSEAWAALYQNEVLPAAKNGLAATVYTQVSDVEDEVNGLFTYDRAVLKVDEAVLKKANEDLKGVVE